MNTRYKTGEIITGPAEWKDKMEYYKQLYTHKFDKFE